MNPVSRDIAQVLSQNGIGQFPGNAKWAICIVQEPSSPVDCITIYDTGGPGPDTDELDVYRATFQVRVRCRAHDEGHAKLGSVMGLLHSLQNVTMNGSMYSGIQAITSVISLGTADSGAFLLTQNYEAHREGAA